MAYLTFKAGTTSKIIMFSAYDSSSTTGAKLSGLVYNSAGLTAYYSREGVTGAATAITLATATKGTWATGGFVAIDGTNMPGDYELHIPDAAIATGAKSVMVQIKGATNLVPVNILIELTAIDNQDSVRFGLTALPNAAAEAAGGLYTRGTGAGQIAQDANGNIRANLDTIKTQTVTCGAGVTVLASVGTAATSTAQTGDAYALTNSRLPAALTANGNMKSSLVEILTTALTETAGQIAAAFKQFFDVATPTGTMKAITNVVTTTNVTNNVGIDWNNIVNSTTTQNLSGTTISAVSGAVGSVTGNMGGNVTGSIGSLGVNSVDSNALHSNACAKIADSGIQRGASFWENNLDNRSLGWAISKLVNKIDLNAAGDTLSIRKSNDTTALFTQTITTSGGAAPITVLDTV